MNKFEITKTVIGLLVGSGISIIVSQAVDNNTAPKNIVQKGLIFAGKTGISMTVGDVVEENMNKKIDAIEKWWNENVNNGEKDASGTPEQQS